MSTSDDLDFNPFYQSLQNEFHLLFEMAQDRCCLICVPQSASIQQAQLDQYFMEMHILRPSPYFKGEYETMDREHTGTVQLDGNVLTTMNGFRDDKLVKILCEEMGYNKDMTTFRILVIERPLVPVTLQKVNELKDVNTLATEQQLQEDILEHDECERFLHSFGESHQALSNLQKEIQVFQENYMVLQGYLQDTVSRLQAMYYNATKMFLRSVRPKLRCEQKVRNSVNGAIESLIVGSVHKKVYPVVCADCQREDDKRTDRLEVLHTYPPVYLGLREELLCPLTSAIQEIKLLEILETPRERLHCIKATMDCITQDVNRAVAGTQANTNEVKKLPCLTSDDYIPLLVNVLVQAECCHLASNMYYIDNFHWSSRATDDLSFAFVTFKAAVHYITTSTCGTFTGMTGSQQKDPVKSTSPSVTHQGRSTHDQLHREADCNASIYESTESSSRLIGDGHSPCLGAPESLVDDSTPSSSGSPKIDRQLNLLTRKLEMSTLDFVDASQISGPPPTRKRATHGVQKSRQNKNGQQGGSLGEFLSALKDDTLHCAYGKQS